MNKKETVYEALTNVKREYVEEAENFSFKKRRANWPRIIGIAAAACLIIALAAILIKPRRDRDKWAVNDPTPAPISSSAPSGTNAPVSTGEPTGTDAPAARLSFKEPVLLGSIPMVKYTGVPNRSELAAATAEALGYLGDPGATVGPVGLTAASDEKFIILDQVCMRLFTIDRDGSFSAHFLDICERPRDLAYLDGGDPSLGDPVVSPEDAIVVNDDGSQNAILDDGLRSFVGEGLIAVLDSEDISVLRLPDMELICTVSLSEQYCVYDFNYGHNRLRFADGKLYFEASSEKAYTVGVAALFENEHIGAEMLEEAPAMPQVSDVTDYTAPVTEVPDGMTVSHGWIKKLQVEGWGRSWSVEADLITPIDAHNELLLAETAVGGTAEGTKRFVGLYSSETDASCTMELDSENRLMAAQFAMSPSGRVYMMEFYADRAELYELVYEAAEAEENKVTANEPLRFTSHFALSEFIESTKLSDAAFESYAKANMLENCGITRRAHAIETLKNLQSASIPILEGRVFDVLTFDRRGECVFVGWGCALNKVFSVTVYSSADDIENPVSPVSTDTFAVELDPSSPISELYGSRLVISAYSAYNFIGKLEGGAAVKISTKSYSREEAEELIRSLEFGTPDRLVEAARNPSAMSATFYSTAEIAEFIASSELEEAEFASYIESSGIQGFSSSEDARGLVVSYSDMRFPVPAGYYLKQISLGIYANKVQSTYRSPGGESFAYTRYPPSMSGSVRDMLECSFEQLEAFGAFELEANPDFPLRDFWGISHNDLDRLRGFSDAEGVYTATGEYLFFGWLDGCYVEFETIGCDRYEAAELIRSLDYLTLAELAETADPNAPANEWFVDTAWEYARLANEVHGYAFTKNNVTQRRGSQERSISFYSEAEEWIWVVFYRRNDGEWYEAYCEIMGKWPEDGEFDDLNVNWDEIRVEDVISVTKAELERAGYALSGGDDDLIAVSQYCGDLICAKYTGCSEDNALRCYEAKAVNPKVRSLPMFSGGYADCMVQLRFRPVNTRVFTWSYSDVGCSAAGPDDPMPGYIGLYRDIQIWRTEDGFTCNLGYGDGSVGWGNISLVDDPMDYLPIHIERVIAENAESSTIDSSGVWVIRMLYGMDWEWFEREYGEDIWPQLVERLKLGSITWHIGHKEMCMHAMRGALFAPEKYRAGFGELLRYQRANDETAFSYCLSELTAEQRAIIEAIVSE